MRKAGIMSRTNETVSLNPIHLDRLSDLLANISLNAGVFYTGNICGNHEFHEDRIYGHLHLIRRGPVKLSGEKYTTLTITEPTLLFLPRPRKHRLIAHEATGADVVCGTIQLGISTTNLITDALPDVIQVKLGRLPGVESLLDVMFKEAFSEHPGRQAVLDRLCEVLMIWLLRYCIDHGLSQNGTLAGLADRRISLALQALYKNPEKPWDLSLMASLSGMSRARFAVRFREVIGQTPAEYLASLRIMIAQRLLKQGRQLKHIALEVGYATPSALTRAFVRKLGQNPTEWMKRLDSSMR